MAFALLLALLAGNVNTSVANMHSKASTDSDVVSQAIYGAPVQYLEEAPGWVKVKTADDYSGWVESSRLKTATKPYASAGKTATVESLFSHIYREASVTKHQPLLTVPFETKLEIIAEPEANGRWLQVRLVDDSSGWIQRGDLQFSNQRMTIPETIELSKRFLGLPYTWGGTSSFGYDCSGFTQMLCRRRAINMPRDAGPQARWEGVKEVKRSNLEPGDLLYFGRNLEKIDHTGYYIGNGEFIHATTNNKPVVQISKLDDEHWTKLFVTARRPK